MLTVSHDRQIVHWKCNYHLTELTAKPDKSDSNQGKSSIVRAPPVDWWDHSAIFRLLVCASATLDTSLCSYSLDHGSIFKQYKQHTTW